MRENARTHYGLRAAKINKTNMRNNIAISIWVLTCWLPMLLSAQPQTPPAWLHPQVREATYPPETFFSEFTEGNLRPGESVSELLDRLKSDAKRGAAGNIRTLIESVVEKTDRQETYGQEFRFTSVYQDRTQQTANADIAGIHTESYYDEQRRWGYAFAYVRKSDLAAYYRAQVGHRLQEVENNLSLAAQLMDNGEKAKARKVCEEALQPLSNAEFARDLLAAVCPGDTTGMQSSRYFPLKNRLLQTLIDLEQSTYVCLQCTETNFGQKVRIVEPELKRLLAVNQCSITDDPGEADFVITVTASTRRHDGNAVFGDGVLKFSLADVEVEVFSNSKRKVVYSESLSQKNNGDGATYESAGRNALKLAAGAVWEKIKPFVLGE